jgi:hypothetical protein
MRELHGRSPDSRADMPTWKRMGVTSAIATLVSIPIASWVLHSAGAGHGSYGPARIAFPWAVLALPIAWSFPWLSTYFVAFLQFPLYGLYLGWSWSRGQEGRGTLIIAVSHVAGIVLSLWLVPSP